MDGDIFLVRDGLQREAEIGGAPFQVMQNPLSIAFLEVRLPSVHVLGALGQHGVDQAGQFMGGGG